MLAPGLCQIAFSVTDLRRTHHWYRDLLGFEPAGGTNLFFGPTATKVQGVPGAASTCWWLVDRQDFFQLELFEFRRPMVRTSLPDQRPCDIGYSSVGIHVHDFDATTDALRRAGHPSLTDPVGPPGARRVCVRDPEGVLLELMEDDPRSGPPRERPRNAVPVVTRSITASVADLARSRRFFVDTLGLPVAEGVTVHQPEHQAMWGLAGAQCQSLVLSAGDMLIELVQYDRPIGRPRPAGYRISDQGLLNIALGFRSKAAVDEVYRRCIAAGYRANWRPMNLGSWSVVYVNDDQGFSVELLHVKPWYDRFMGFIPKPVPRIAPFVGRTAATARTGKTFRKALVTGAAGGLGAELCRCLAADGTDLVVLDRDVAGLEALDAELGGRVAVSVHPVDLTDLEAVDQAARAIVTGHPNIDLLIANAGVDRVHHMANLDWRAMRDDFHVNTLANLVLFGANIPAMIDRGGGHIAATLSLGGLLGFPFEAAYSASKAALATITESARAELATHGITFTSVFPGFIDTPMARANAFKKPYLIPARNAMTVR